MGLEQAWRDPVFGTLSVEVFNFGDTDAAIIGVRFMYRDKKISLVIPAYNEERLIGPTLDAATDVIDHIYVVDDCSTDGMAEVVKARAEADPRIEYICHEVNSGVGQGIITGYLKSSEDGYDIAVVVGGDNQMPLEVVNTLLDPVIDGEADYVKGNRFMEAGLALDTMPKTRLIPNAIISMLTKISSGFGDTYDVVDGYTAISKKAIDTINWDLAWKGYGYPMDFLMRINAYGFHLKDVPRRAIYLPGERQSQIKGLQYFCRVTPMLVKNFFFRIFRRYIIRDFHPLVFFYLCGILLLPSSCLYSFWLVLKQVAGVGVSGSQAVLAALGMLMGMQFIMFAMIFDLQSSKKTH